MTFNTDHRLPHMVRFAMSPDEAKSSEHKNGDASRYHAMENGGPQNADVMRGTSSPRGTPGSPRTTVGLLAAFGYGLCSISTAFANKALLSSYEFEFEFFIMFVQMVTLALMLEFLRASRWLSFPRYTLAKGRKMLWPSVFYSVHGVVSLVALQGLNIPMYGLIRRCSPLLTLILSSVVLNKEKPPPPIVLSVVMITTGCVVAGYGDLAFDAYSYIMGFLSVATQSAYLVFLQNSSHSSMALSETLYLNAINTIPAMTAGVLLSQELVPALQFFSAHAHDFGLHLVFVTVIFMGCALNYLSFLCTTLNCALTTTIVGTLKAVLQTIIGMFTFGGIAINIFTLSGIGLNLGGGLLYSFQKSRSR